MDLQVEHTSFPLQAHFTGQNEVAGRVRRFLENQKINVDDLTIESNGGSVVLRGKVSSPSEKRICLECSRRVAGVIHVIDELNALYQENDLLETPAWRTRPR